MSIGKDIVYAFAVPVGLHRPGIFIHIVRRGFRIDGWIEPGMEDVVAVGWGGGMGGRYAAPLGVDDRACRLGYARVGQSPDEVAVDQIGDDVRAAHVDDVRAVGIERRWIGRAGVQLLIGDGSLAAASRASGIRQNHPEDRAIVRVLNAAVGIVDLGLGVGLLG